MRGHSLLNPDSWMDRIFLWIFSITGLSLSLDATIDVLINLRRFFL